MNDNEFWISVWKLVTIGVCCLVLSISGCVVHSKYRIAKAIEQGANPIEAKFAFKMEGTGDNTVTMGHVVKCKN